MDHIDGMKYSLKLIESLRDKYESIGFKDHDLSIDRVLKDVENEIGICCIKDWRLK